MADERGRGGGGSAPHGECVMENGKCPRGAEPERRNCHGPWRSAARLNRVETRYVHKTFESESLQLSFLAAREKSLLPLLDKHFNVRWECVTVKVLLSHTVKTLCSNWRQSKQRS